MQSIKSDKDLSIFYLRKPCLLGGNFFNCILCVFLLQGVYMAGHVDRPSKKNFTLSFIRYCFALIKPYPLKTLLIVAEVMGGMKKIGFSIT